MSIIPINYIKPSNNFSEMPEDIKNHILSFVDVPGLQSTLQSSKTFSEVILLESPKNMYNDIVSFIDGVCEKLKDDPESITKQNLLKIKGSIKTEFESLLEVNEKIDKLQIEFNESKNIQEYAGQKQALLNVRYLKNKQLLNLSKLRLFIAEKREKIIDALMTLSKEDLTALKNINAPMFCKNIWKIVEICRKIPIAKSIENFVVFNKAIKKITIDLVAAGELNRALEVAKISQGEYLDGRFLSSISSALIKIGDINKALEVANMFQVEYEKGNTLLKISKALIEVGDIDKAIEVAYNIQEKHTCDRALQDAVKALIESGDINKAIEVVYNIQERKRRDISLRNISEASSKLGNIDRAIEATYSIQDEVIRDEALKNTSKALAEACNIDRAIVVAKDIKGFFTFRDALVNISVAQANTGNIGNVLDIADTQSNTDTQSNMRECILKLTSIALIEIGDINRAADVMNLLNQNP